GDAPRAPRLGGPVEVGCVLGLVVVGVGVPERAVPPLVVRPLGIWGHDSRARPISRSATRSGREKNGEWLVGHSTDVVGRVVSARWNSELIARSSVHTT